MRRFWFAALLAPAVALLTIWGGTVGLMARSDVTGISFDGLRFSARYFGIVGLPVAYLASYALAGPAYLLLKRTHRLSFATAVATAAALGAVAFPIVVALLFAEASEIPTLLAAAALGALAGAAAGAVFYAIGCRGETRPSGHQAPDA